jgi:hypothetical protein
VPEIWPVLEVVEDLLALGVWDASTGRGADEQVRLCSP